MAKTPEQRLESKQLRELRKQVIRLKRENAQLRKRNSRIENDFADLHAESEEYFEEEVTVREIEYKCPKCFRKINPFILRQTLYYKCHSPDCGSKGVLKSGVESV